MKIHHTSAEQVAGLSIGLLGWFVALGWVFASQTIARMIPGSERMGIVTPSLFMATGFCLFFAQRRGGRALDSAWAICCALLLAVPLLVLFEHVTGLAIGVDFVRAPTAPTATLPHPGRMAPNSCVGFLLAGIALTVTRHPALNGRQRALLGVCAGTVLVIGFAALVGYFLRLEVLYRVAAYNAMVAPTAVGMSVLGFGLWSLRSAMLGRAQGQPRNYERRITVRAIGIVALVALSAGAAGFAAMRDSYEQSIAENTLLTATTSAAALGNTLETSLWFPRAVASRLSVQQALDVLEGDHDNAAARATLTRVGDSFFDAGITAYQFYSVDGELLVAGGASVQSRVVSRHPLAKAGQNAELMFAGAYYLYTEHDIALDGRLVGRIVAEQSLPIVDRLLADIRARSASSDILVCTLDQNDAYCSPTRFYPAPFRIPMYRANGKVNLPINHALLGGSGVQVTQDLRGIPVFAGYTPVRNYGLGVVIKSNVDTLYSPLRQRANVLLVALLALVGMGASALLIQVRPLLAQLVAEQRRSRVILDNSNDAFIALGVNGEITDWNGEAERTFGWSAAEAVGRRLSDLIVPPAQRAAHDHGFAQFTKSGKGPVINQRLEVSAICRDGREIPIELSVAAFHNGEGYVANAFVRDITERHRLAGEIAARTTELEHERDRAQAANRAKGEFVANMSHELRTPMNAVLGMTYLLAHSSLNAEQRKSVEMIRSSGQSLLGIMNDILDFSKVEAGRMELKQAPFRLGDVLGAIANIMSVNAGEKDLELAIGVAPQVPALLIGDALRLQQVLVNLVGNAVKFTEQGEVSVLVSAHAIGAGPDGVDRVALKIDVRDTGIGIGKEDQARLFSPFTQVDSSRTRRFGGTGLGLTISKHLTDLMGGRIELDSAEGQGSTFRITLPLGVAAPQGSPDDGAASAPSLRILIVDDNLTSRECLAQTVSSAGWQGECVDSGGAALARMREHATAPFDAVLLDWQMPGLDGLASARALRLANPHPGAALILMVNEYGRGKVMASADARQVDAIVSKPVTAAALAAALREVRAGAAADGAQAGTPINLPDSAAFGMAPPLAARRLDGVRLLLAEDNELNQAVARGILERVGAHIDIVDNGELALARLAARPDDYDLVLMDIQMPLMDGYEATRGIRGALRLSLPIVAMTAGVTAAEREACMACGMDDLIAKPIEVDEMLETIARHVGPNFAPITATTIAPTTASTIAPTTASTIASTTASTTAPVAAPAANELLPVLRLEPLINIARGNPAHLASVAKLVRRMIDDGGAQFDTAMAHWRAGEPDKAARVLHALRGGVGSVGAKRFAASSLTLEHAIRLSIEQGDGAEVERLFLQTQQDLNAAISAANAWLDSETTQRA